MSGTTLSRRTSPARNAWHSLRFGGGLVRRLNSRFRLPRILTVALVLAAVGLSGGCSMFSSSKKESDLPYNPWFKPATEDSKPSWIESILPAKEKPKRVDQWINQERPGS
jgi:hypothetical protein